MVISPNYPPVVLAEIVNEPSNENNVLANIDLPQSDISDISKSQDQSTFTAQWELLVKTLSRQKGKRFFIGALLRSCASYSIESGKLVLKYRHKSHMERMKEEWEDPSTRKTIKEVIQQIMGHPYDLFVDADDKENSNTHRRLTDSHLVKAAMRMGATIIEKKEEQHE